MKKPQKQKNRLIVTATLLLLLAIPIGVVGTQTIQDFRNRAEYNPNLHFENNFESESITKSYIGIPYEVDLKLAGDQADNAEISLGCDEYKCGKKCQNIENNPPEGLDLSDDLSSIIWTNPQKQYGKSSWDLTISAVAEVDENTYECSVESYTLTTEEKTSNDPPQCEILFSNKNLDKIPQDFEASFILQGIDLDDGISEASVILSQDGKKVDELKWDFNNENYVVINKDNDPSLSYVFDQLGSYSISAKMKDASGQSSTCVDSNKQINIVIPGDNGSPEFTTNPYTQSSPGTSIKVGTQYSYTVEAKDNENDDLDYFIINETGWLSFALNRNENGEFKGTFSGTPSEPGSYTGVIAINDGLHRHYSTQIWVINVDSEANDTPKVNVVLPGAGAVIPQSTSTKIQWDATDSNLIQRFDVYLATNPANESTWHPLAIDLGYNFDSYIWNVGATAPGTYYIVVKATDNQTPAATGIGVSGSFVVSEGGTAQPGQQQQTPTDDTTIPENYPQVKNLRPKDKSKTEERKPLISADISASQDSTIKKGSVQIKLDDNDITESAEIRGEDKAEGSVIYTPQESLNKGNHKVSISFKDNSDKVAQKNWTFEITEEKEEEEETQDYITIFGLKIPKRVALIIGIGLALLILAVMIPWLFYAAWKRSVDEDSDDFGSLGTVSSSPSIPPPSPPSETTPMVMEPSSSFESTGIRTQPVTAYDTESEEKTAEYTPPETEQVPQPEVMPETTELGEEYKPNYFYPEAETTEPTTTTEDPEPLEPGETAAVGSEGAEEQPPEYQQETEAAEVPAPPTEPQYQEEVTPKTEETQQEELKKVAKAFEEIAPENQPKEEPKEPKEIPLKPSLSPEQADEEDEPEPVPPPPLTTGKIAA